MPKLFLKEVKYIGVKFVSNDPMQARDNHYINPTYNLVNWMRAKNIQENHSMVLDIGPDGANKLDFGRKIKMADGSERSLFSYVDKILSDWNMEIKKPEGFQK